MTTKKYIKLVAVVINSILVILLANTSVFALEIEISGNGAGSDSEVVVSETTENNISQDNNTDIKNNVSVTADSGSNSANQNSGEVDIVSGNVDVYKSVTNQNIGNSEVDNNCCEGQEVGVEVVGNGTNSENCVNLNISQNTNISTNQNTRIKNDSTINANSGSNSANQNSGDVNIKTGDIQVVSQTTNKNINNHDVNFSKGETNLDIKIKNNATGSKNKILFNLDSQTNIYVDSKAKIKNNENINANSGSNSANQNSGDVSIETGEVTVLSLLENEDINDGSVDVECCDPDDPQDPDDPDDPDDPQPPVTPPEDSSSGGGGSSSGSSSSSSSSPGGGGVLGMGVGTVLAATGSNFLLYMTIANILTFLFGVYLRLRGGRSPDYEIELAFSW